MSRRKRAHRDGKRKRRGAGYKLSSTRSFSITNRPNITFIDPHMYVTLRYTETVQFSNLTTVGSQNIFNLNSCFDPNRTGTGHQPYGFDQLAALYNRYRVLKVKWTIVFGPTSNLPVYCVVVPVNGLLATNITGVSSFESACEVPFAWSNVVPNAGTASHLTHRGGISLNRLNGVTKTEYLADDRFEAQVTATPIEVLTLYIGIYNANGSTVANGVLVTIDYEADFHDPIIASSSFKQPPTQTFKLVKV